MVETKSQDDVVVEEKDGHENKDVVGEKDGDEDDGDEDDGEKDGDEDDESDDDESDDDESDDGDGEKDDDDEDNQARYYVLHFITICIYMYLFHNSFSLQHGSNISPSPSPSLSPSTPSGSPPTSSSTTDDYIQAQVHLTQPYGMKNMGKDIQQLKRGNNRSPSSSQKSGACQQGRTVVDLKVDNMLRFLQQYPLTGDELYYRRLLELHGRFRLTNDEIFILMHEYEKQMIPEFAKKVDQVIVCSHTISSTNTHAHTN